MGSRNIAVRGGAVRIHGMLTLLSQQIPPCRLDRHVHGQPQSPCGAVRIHGMLMLLSQQIPP